MKKYIIIFFLFIVQTAYSDISDYPAEIIKVIINGKNVGELLHKKYEQPGNPTCFGFTKDNLIFFCDSYNYRIQVFNQNMDFIKIFTDKSKIEKKYFFSINMVIDDLNNVILSNHQEGLIKINSEGNKVFYIEREKLPETVLYSKYLFSKHDVIFFYDKKNNIQMIDKDGKIMSSEDAKASLNYLYTINTSKNDFDVLKNYAVENHLIFINNTILPYAAPEFIKHYNNLNNIFKKNSTKTDTSDKSNIGKINFDFMLDNFIGVDKQGISCFTATKIDTYEAIIIVISKFGEILDYFSNKYDSMLMEVSPDGDLYFMKRGTEKSFEFYKITRRW